MDDAKLSRLLHTCAESHAAVDRELGAKSECGLTEQLREAAHQVGARADRGHGHGPAQVATAAYRTNYDTIFGRPVTVGEA